MIIDTLTRKRNDIAAQIRELTESLTHLDATIKLFAPEYQKPRLKRGDISRAIFDAIRSAGKPLTTAELSQATSIDMKRMGTILSQQYRRGQVKRERREDGLNLWGLEDSRR